MIPLLLLVSVQRTAGTVVIRGEGYALVVSVERGEFDFLLRLPGGDFVSVVRQGGEKFWFGYNDPGGERRSDRNSPLKLTVRRLGRKAEVEVLCPVDPEAGSLHRAVYIALPKFVVVRSKIVKGAFRGKASIVRVAPRADIDISLLTHFAFSAPGGKVVAGEVHKLGRPGYAGVLPWGGPIVADSLDPKAPFFALYNPKREVGFLLLYPFYDRFWFWANHHIFLQLWRWGTNFLYCGFGGEGFFDKEFLFVLAPAEAFNPEGLKGQALRLTKFVEEAVRKGEIHCPRLRKHLQAEAEFPRLFKEVRRLWEGLVKGLIEGKIDASTGLSTLRRVNFLLSLAYMAMEKGDVEEALSLLREAVTALKERQ